MDRRSFLITAGVAVASNRVLALADDLPLNVLDGKLPKDSRLGKPIDYNGYFPWTPPTSKEQWEKRRQDVREQVLVANGLWPLPEKTPLNPVIHGKIDRDGYTIEKVFFASMPGHYVTGNLYRPRDAKGKRAGVLCPHGHWANGRFFEASDKEVENQLKQGAEKTKEGARYPLQARCATLARMGCIVFHYDMVGYADSKPIVHREGLVDVDSELRLQNTMGLQTWNSIRALDFLLDLKDVDPRRVGVTGASGGGTQTFILCGIDDRPTVAVPAVMVSTAMQGGCVCENCSHLRVDTGNIELAGLFAPKPMRLIGADDWTIDIETRGLPELKALYKLLGAEDRVSGKCHKEFKHNYNQVSRELMYDWFNKYLDLGHKDTAEKPFVPVPPKELTVFDEQHPLPRDAAAAIDLRKTMAVASDKQIHALMPKDAASLKEFQRVVGTALRVMIGDKLPAADEVESRVTGQAMWDKVVFNRHLLGRKGKGEEVPAVFTLPADFNGTVVVWVHPAGKSSLIADKKVVPAARQILDARTGLLAIDPFMTGEFAAAKVPPVNEKFAGYTFGYNRSLLANRVHDILTAVAFARAQKGVKTVHLVGFDKAGPWVLLARPFCGEAVARAAADVDQFRFDKLRSLSDEMMLPGALKYGGLSALAAVAAPAELLIHNNKATGAAEWLSPAYRVAGKPENFKHSGEPMPGDKVIEWLLR